jgi:SpoIID/LytB domain protein
MTCRFRRVLAVTFVILMLPSIAAGSTEGNLVVTGGGWGHSVGLSQYGAQGMALEGYTHTQILQHYFTGVEVKSVAGINDLRVGLAQSPVSASFKAIDGHMTISRDGIPLQDVLQNNVVVVTSPAASVCVISIPTDPSHVPSQGSCQIDFTKPAASKIETVATLSSGATTAVRVINYGFVYVRAAPTRFHVGAQMDLEGYLRGIAEIPNAWHVEAQRTQVVAARSFAQASTAERRLSAVFWNELCYCDLRATTADQNYTGYTSEVARPKWNQAVTDTPGRVITAAGGSVALKAYYSSSTFGRTEPFEVGFGGGLPRSYLKSVDDHWAVQPAVSNPFATWVDTTPIAQAAQALGFATLTGATPIETSPGGAISKIRFTGTNSSGATITIDYATNTLRDANRLGLRSMQVTSVGLVFEGEQVVLHDPSTGKWFLRNSSGQVSTFFYGNPGDLAFMGDWNCDGVDTPGLYRRSTGFAYVRNSNTTGVADSSFFFGIPGDIPIAGDFDGNGCDSVSIYRPSEAKFYIINQLGSEVEGVPVAEFEFFYGNPGDVPFVGDWNNDNIDTPGLRRPSDGFVYLRNSNNQGVADIAFFYGNSGDIPFAGDWDLDGSDSIGLLRPSNKTVYLRNALSTGVADISFAFGESRYRPAGAWNG